MAGGSPGLERFLSEVLRDSIDPASGKSMPPRPFHLEPLGAGSDYVPFLDHLGVASLNLGFGGGEAAGVYHSIYDTFAWYKKFGDPDFLYGKALARITAASLLRLADAPVLPFEFESLAHAAKQYTEEIQKQAAGRVPLDRVLAELARISATSRIYETELASFLGDHARADPARRKQLNEVLFRTERALTLAQGLPRRPWYRHQISAPGLYTGYGAKTLPGVREAVEGGRWEEAGQQAQALALTLHEFNAGIEEAARLLDQPAGSR